MDALVRRIVKVAGASDDAGIGQTGAGSPTDMVTSFTVRPASLLDGWTVRGTRNFPVGLPRTIAIEKAENIALEVAPNADARALPPVCPR